MSGIDRTVVIREIETLARAQCILTEDLTVKGLSEADLVRLGPAGFVHLELVGNLSYLSAVAEDTYFSMLGVAERVAERIKTYDLQFGEEMMLANARELLQLLEGEAQTSQLIGASMLSNSAFPRLADLAPIKNCDFCERKIQSMVDG